MAQLLVRNLDDTVRDRLRDRAKLRGHSLEQEVRDILLAASVQNIQPEYGLGTQIAALFRDCGLEEGEELTPLPRQQARPAQFEP